MNAIPSFEEYESLSQQLQTYSKIPSMFKKFDFKIF